jgi:hypothetical protein
MGLFWRHTLGHSWQSIMENAVAKCGEVGARVLVVDTISQFAQLAGDKENNAGDVLEVYRPLQEAAAKGLAVISVRHERKSGGDVANAGRGSSAFAGERLTLSSQLGNPKEIHDLRLGKYTRCLVSTRLPTFSQLN